MSDMSVVDVDVPLHVRKRSARAAMMIVGEQGLAAAALLGRKVVIGKTRASRRADHPVDHRASFLPVAHPRPRRTQGGFSRFVKELAGANTWLAAQIRACA